MEEVKLPATPKKMPGKKKVVGLRVSSDCSQGGRKHMEDVISIVFDRKDDSDYACFAVFDGHGGRQAAVYARDHLWENIKKQRGFFTEDHGKVMGAIKEGFLVTQAAMEKVRPHWPLTATGYPSTAGTTVAMVIINKNNMYVAHVGDSRIVAGVKNMYDKVEAKALTIDHKPSNRSEIERIEKLGGQVLYKNGVPRVVWTRTKHSHRGPVRRSTNVDHIPFLAVARSLGDLWSYQFEHEDYLVSPEPDITHHIIDPEHHKFLIIGSDGLWNMMSVHDSVRLVEKYSWERANKGSVRPMCYTVSKQIVQTTINKWNARSLRADNTTAITIFFEFPEILDDEDDQVDLASYRCWHEFGLSMNGNYQFEGAKRLLAPGLEYCANAPSSYDPYRKRKCWHYNFTAKANEICNACKQCMDQDIVRAYSSREQTVYMQSPKGPWIMAKEHRTEMQKIRKRDGLEDDDEEPPRKKHKLNTSTPHGATPNKEIMVKTVKGMVKVQIYGFGKTDSSPDEKVSKKDDKKEESKDDTKEEEPKGSDKKGEDDEGPTIESESFDVDEKKSVKLSEEQTAALEKEYNEEMQQTKKRRESARKSVENSPKDSAGKEVPEAAELESSSSESKESSEKAKVKGGTPIVKKKPVPITSAPILRKSPRNSSKLSCLKDSNSVAKTRYNTRYSLSPKGAIKRALRTVNSKNIRQQRQRTKSLPASTMLKNKAVTRSAVKIR